MDPGRGKFTLTELVSVSAIESILSNISQAVIGRELFDRVNDAIELVETGAFFFSIALWLALSDSLQPGFPYTVATLDKKNHFILTNESYGGDQQMAIDFLYHGESLNGTVNLTHFAQSVLNGDVQLEFSSSTVSTKA